MKLLRGFLRAHIGPASQPCPAFELRPGSGFEVWGTSRWNFDQPERRFSCAGPCAAESENEANVWFPFDLTGARCDCRTGVTSLAWLGMSQYLSSKAIMVLAIGLTAVAIVFTAWMQNDVHFYVVVFFMAVSCDPPPSSGHSARCHVNESNISMWR